MQVTIKRGVYLTDPKTGEEVCRRDYIKTLYMQGSEEYNIVAGHRRSIVNHLKERFNHIVPFQIVFQATAGCDRPTMDVNDSILVKVGEKAKAEVQRQIEEGNKAAAVVEKIVSRK